MTALIADTSPILRNIPSDPAPDRRSFGGFSTSHHMPARYLSEGRPTERQSPNPRSYAAQEMPASLYPHGYAGYPVKEAFGYDDPGAPARVPRKSCRCQYECACSTTGGSNCHHLSAEAPSSRWRKDTTTITSSTHQQQQQRAHGSRSRLSAVQVPSRSPSPLAVLACSAKLELSPAGPAGKKSDWENLLGAVDLELRAQRAERVPEPPAARAVPRFEHHHYHHTDRSPLHHSTVGANRYLPSSSGLAASVSPELGPRKPTHRRGGGMDEVAGGGPAYSGSTADAACLLATLPQRMLDRASTSTATATQPPASFKPLQPLPPSATPAAAVYMPSPAVVSANAGSVPAPIRVQASGRRGPRGQSRFKGVCITRAGKWRAVIYIGRKQKYLGVFDSEFDAARAYDAAALQHFAEGAKLNFPDGVEQQLNEISSGGCGKPFETAGAGGAAAARSSTPPAMEEGGGASAAAAAVAGGGAVLPASAAGRVPLRLIRRRMSGYGKVGRGRTGDEKGDYCGGGSGGGRGWKFLPLIGGLGSSRAEMKLRSRICTQQQEEEDEEEE